MRYSKFPQKRKVGENTKTKKKRVKPPIKKEGKYSDNQELPEMGDFKEKIIRLLCESKKPMSPATIGKKLKRSQEFVFVWLSSVGKSITQIRKITTKKYIYIDKE